MSPQITVTLDLFDAAAIPAALRSRRDDVDRHLRARADILTSDEKAGCQRFMDQLERCAHAFEHQLNAKGSA